MPVKSKQQLLKEVTAGAQRMAKVRATSAKNKIINTINEPTPLRTVLGDIGDNSLSGIQTKGNNPT